MERRVRRAWVNWETYLKERAPETGRVLAARAALLEEYAEYTPEAAEQKTGIDADTIREIAAVIGANPTKFASHNWRAAGAGNMGGWQVARCLFFLNVLTGSVATKGGTAGNGMNKFKPHDPIGAPNTHEWNHLEWPKEFPLAYHEMSILLPHFLNEGRGTRRLLQPGLQPDLDQSRRLHLDGGVEGRNEGEVSRGAHPDLVRDVVVR